MLSENELIRQKFKETGYETAKEFCRGTNSSLTSETYAAVLYRDTNAALKSLLVMMVELKFSAQEIQDVLMQRGETKIASLLEHVTLSVDEKNLVDEYRSLPKEKRGVVHTLMGSLH